MDSQAHIPWIELRVADHCNNVCRHCNQRSPQAAKRDHDAAEYLPWLGRLAEGGVSFDQINLTGGEPFLHHDLTGFTAAFRVRFPQTALVLISNGFWLGERAFAAHREVFTTVNALVFSLYPNIEHMHGGREAMLAKLGRLKHLHPDLEIVTVGRAAFYPVSFDVSVVPPAEPCRWADCTGLSPDGRLTRCTVASSAGIDDADMVFDLRGDLSGLGAWRAKWPLEACRHCNAMAVSPLPWKAGAPTRRLDFEAEYFSRLQTAAP
jgi:hypothetical protein